MASCLEALRIWEFEKKTVSRDSSLEEVSRFLGSTKCVARGGVWWKSQHRKKLCLSLLMSKNLKLKKVIKSYVPEPISSVFGFLHALWTIYEHYVYFTYPYHGYVTIWSSLYSSNILITKTLLLIWINQWIC